ncbi:MAG: hypothetical protein AB1Z98_32365, partial [Nannocystaceae bacterium]
MEHADVGMTRFFVATVLLAESVGGVLLGLPGLEGVDDGCDLGNVLVGFEIVFFFGFCAARLICFGFCAARLICLLILWSFDRSPQPFEVLCKLFELVIAQPLPALDRLDGLVQLFTRHRRLARADLPFLFVVPRALIVQRLRQLVELRALLPLEFLALLDRIRLFIRIRAFVGAARTWHEGDEGQGEQGTEN